MEIVGSDMWQKREAFQVEKTCKAVAVIFADDFYRQQISELFQNFYFVLAPSHMQVAGIYIHCSKK